MRRLAISTVLVATAYGGLYEHPSAKPPHPSDWIDVALVMGFGSLLTVAALVMLMGTRRWSARQMGLFWTTAASGMLWDGATWARLEQRGLPEWYVDIFRACLIVGVPLFAFGLCAWVAARYRHAVPEDVIEPQNGGSLSAREGAVP